MFPVGGRFVRGNPIGRGNAGRGLWGTLAQPWGGENSAFRKLAPDRQSQALRLAHTQGILAFYSEVQKTSQSSRTVGSSPWESPLLLACALVRCYDSSSSRRRHVPKGVSCASLLATHSPTVTADILCACMLVCVCGACAEQPVRRRKDGHVRTIFNAWVLELL